MNYLIGYRKFTVAVLALLCLTVLCALGRLTGMEFVYGLSATVGAYITLNVMQKKLEVGK